MDWASASGPRVKRELAKRSSASSFATPQSYTPKHLAENIDGATGYHLWADRFDRPLTDLFAVQDEITQRIVTELEVALTEGEQARRHRRATSSVEALEHWARGRAAYREQSREANVRARTHFEAAVAADPDFALGTASLGQIHLVDIYFGYSEDTPGAAAMAEALARKTLALDAQLPEAQQLLAKVHLLHGECEKAVTAAKRALELDPNAADIHAFLAFIYNRVERAEGALVHVTKAMRLSPAYPAWYLTQAGFAYMTLERWEEALDAYQAAAASMPDNWLVRMALACCYQALGREVESHEALAAWRARDPAASLQRAREFFSMANPASRDRRLDLLVRAGLR